MLQRADGDGDIVNGAKTLAMAWKSVMKSSADVESDAIAQSVAGRQNGPAGGQPKAVHHCARIGDFELDDFGLAQRSSFKAMHPAGIVDSQDIVIGNWLWFDEIGWLGEALGEQAVVNQTVLASGEYVIAEIEIVARMVNEPERQSMRRHGLVARRYLLYGHIVLRRCFARIGGCRNHPAWRQNRDNLLRRA